MKIMPELATQNVFSLKETLISLKGMLIIPQQIKCNDCIYAVQKVSSY